MKGEKAIVDYIKKFFNKYKQFIMFATVGIMNTVVTFIAYTLLLKLNLTYSLANFLGDIGGGVNSYFWNRFWVFKGSKAKTIESVPKFIITFALYLTLSWLLMTLCVDYLKIGEILAKVIVLPITTIVNYLMNKLWTFKNKK